MFSIKALAMATAVSAGVVFAMPVASQAMPQSAPVKVDTAKSGNVVDVRHRKWHKRKWRHARYCRYDDDDWRCYRRHRHARYYHRYRYYDEPYYGYYRPYRHHGPGIGLYFNID
ncbi:MAG: hypothetical protein AB7S92_21705 [Parvibaculaceae bacterium]